MPLTITIIKRHEKQTNKTDEQKEERTLAKMQFTDLD